MAEPTIRDQAPATATRPEIVCLCGSTRYITAITRVAADLTLAGVIVVRPEVVSHAVSHAVADGAASHVAAEVKAALDLPTGTAARP